MNNSIHPSALVSAGAQIGREVTIGPFSIVESKVTIGDGCRLDSHVVVKSGSTLGPDNRLFQGVVIGETPQHVSVPERTGRVVIGAGNVLREYVTIHCAMAPESATTLGDHSMVMINAHVGHDCVLGNHVILANAALLGGHVRVQDNAYLSAGVGVHQFCRIGTMAMVGGHARVTQDVLPYIMVDGGTSCVVGLNLIGLRRKGFSTSQIKELKGAYRLIYRECLPLSEILERLEAEYPEGPASRFGEFLSGMKRGFLRERRTPPGATLKLHRHEETKERPKLKQAG